MYKIIGINIEISIVIPFCLEYKIKPDPIKYKGIPIIARKKFKDKITLIINSISPKI